MNKPIRTMSIACMVLFMALLVNATYLQYLQADELNSRNDNKRVRDAEFSRERGAILVNDKSIAESEAVDDEFEYQRVYRTPLKYAHLTGYYSYTYGRNAVELTQNEILSGSDPRLFVNRVVDLFGNSQPEGGDVSLTIDPKAQTAAYDGLRALGDNVECTQPVVRGGLCLGVDGEADVATLGLAVAEQIDHPVDEKARVAAGEDLVLRELHGVTAVGVGVVAGEVGVFQWCPVDPLVLELVVDGFAFGDRLVVDEDRAAFA